MNTLVTKRSSQLDDLLLLLGQTLSQISDRMVQLGLIWYITSSFGESFLIWYLVVGGLPHALLVKYSSALIDRLGALKTVLYSDLARGLIYLVAFILIALNPQWVSAHVNSGVLWLLFVSVFLANIFSAFFNPAIMSLSVEIKENDQVQKLTAKLSSVTSLATIIGPVLGLFVFNRFGLSGLFVISAISYFISTYSISLVTKSRQDLAGAADSAMPTSDFSILGSNAIVGTMLVVFLLMNLMLSPLQILMPSMAKDIFGNSFNALAMLETILGAGVLLGGTWLAIVTVKKRPLFWTWLSLVIVSLSFFIFTVSGHIVGSEVSLFAFSFQTSFLVAAIALLSLGFFLGVANVLIINILQTQPNPHHVPKVMSLVNLISTATLPFSLALLGVLQQWTTISFMGSLAGFLLIGISLVSFYPFRRFGQEIFK